MIPITSSKKASVVTPLEFWRIVIYTLVNQCNCKATRKINRRLNIFTVLLMKNKFKDKWKQRSRIHLGNNNNLALGMTKSDLVSYLATVVSWAGTRLISHQHIPPATGWRWSRRWRARAPPPPRRAAGAAAAAAPAARPRSRTPAHPRTGTSSSTPGTAPASGTWGTGISRSENSGWESAAESRASVKDGTASGTGAWAAGTWWRSGV